MSCYYIHKVGHQEMGSVNSRGERPSRGRYFFIAKTCLVFFPHISSVVMNDKIVLTIVPMMDGKEEKKVYCTMDYHNQKFADIEYVGKHPRNEIRLYMNNSIDPDREYFFKGDLAVFEKFEIGKETFYSLTRITPAFEEYEFLLDLVETNDTRSHSNLLLDCELDFIKKPDFEEISEVVVTKEAQDVIEKESTAILQKDLFDDVEPETDQETQDEEPSIEDSMGSSIFNSALFHDLVMNAYGYKCAVTGRVIRYKEGKVDLFNLEAAHIKPQAHEGTFLPCNGIALSRDMHFAFDKGFFTISDDYTIIVSEKVKDSWLYKEYNGHKIFVPTEPFYRPQPKFLQHHREKVFDTFRQIRKLNNSHDSKKYNYPEEETGYGMVADNSSIVYDKR